MTYPRRMITKTAFTPTGPSGFGSAPGIWRLDEVAYWQKQGLWPNPNILPDTYFPYVSLLLSSTSLSNANNNLFVDSSGAFNPVSRNGNTTQGSFTPYGSDWGWNFSGVASRYFLIGASSAFALGTGDFTLEAWFNQSAKSFNYPRFINFGPSNWDTSDSGALIVDGNTYPGKISFETWSGIAVVSTTTVQNGVWYHVALTRSGNTFKLYVNGVLETTVTSSTAVTTSATVACRIGAGGYTNDSFNGYVSNLRLVKGSVLYTSNFTPSTTPLTAVSGTSLLTCQANRFIDASSNNFTMTPSTGQSSPSTVSNDFSSVTGFSPFSSSTYTGISYNQSDITNWSGYFNGGTDRLQVPVTSNMYLGTTYTIEAWVYYNSTSYGARPIFNEMEPFQGGFAYLGLGMNTSGQFVFDYRPATSGAVTTITGPTVTPNTWHHIAVSNNATSAKMFVNGVQVGSTTTIGDYPSAKTNTVAVGGWGSGWNDGGIPAAAWIGYISNLRVVKGTAVYTSNFTPPTSPLTAISGTVLLTCQNAAFTDNSSVNNILTPVTNATVTGNSPFNTTGYWSNYFDGTGDYLTYGTNAAFDYASGNFTIEGWFYFTNSTANAIQTLFSNYTSFGSAGSIFWGKHTNNSGYVTVWFSNYSTGGPLLAETTYPPNNAWTHYALVRNGNTFTLYRNGVSTASATWSGAATSGSCPIWVGTNGDGTQYAFPGYISNFRIVKGTAVYTGAFTPSTTPLTAISGTSLLTCQSSRFLDTSVNAFTTTVYGDTKVQPFNPFYTATIASNGGSMYFDGNGDNLTAPDSPLFEFGGSDFSIDYWFYLTALKGYQCFVSKPGASDGYGFASYIESNNTVAFISGNGGWTIVLNSGLVPVINQWYHAAITRQGNQWRLFLNGVLTATQNNSFSIPDLAYPLYIGKYPNFPGYTPTQDLSGYMAGLRMVKGSVPSLFDTSSTTTGTKVFTPPTAPVTPTAATTLLLNGMNAGIYDATTINDLETVGNAQVSTVQSKFGGSSMYFAGGVDYLTAPSNPVFQFGTGDFTIEFWLYRNTGGVYQTILDTRSSGTASPWGVFLNSSNQPYILITSDINSSIAVAANTWTHIAITRSNGTLRIFNDGVIGYSGTNTTAMNPTGPLRVGRTIDNVYNLNGYLDDVRITKGVARYTANFTPPTQAFPVY